MAQEFDVFGTDGGEEVLEGEEVREAKCLPVQDSDGFIADHPICAEQGDLRPAQAQELPRRPLSPLDLEQHNAAVVVALGEEHGALGIYQDVLVDMKTDLWRNFLDWGDLWRGRNLGGVAYLLGLGRAVALRVC